MKRIVSYLFLIPTFMQAMQQLPPSSAVTATFKYAKTAPSLKACAAYSFSNAFNPCDTTKSLSQLFALKEKASCLPAKMKEFIRNVILMQHAGVLERITDAQPIAISAQKFQDLEKSVGYQGIENNLVITTEGRKVTISKKSDKSLIKQINYYSAVNSAQHITHHKIMVRLRNDDLYEDVMITDSDTGATKGAAYKIATPLSLQEITDASHQLLISTQKFSDIETKMSLIHCLHARALRYYIPKDFGIKTAKITADGTRVLIRAYSSPGTDHDRHYLYYTYKGLTQGITLDQLLGLLIAERQRIENKEIDKNLIAQLCITKNDLLYQVALKRYAAFKPASLLRYVTALFNESEYPEQATGKKCGVYLNQI